MGWEADDEAAILLLTQGTSGAVDPLTPCGRTSHDLVTRRSKLTTLVYVFRGEDDSHRQTRLDQTIGMVEPVGAEIDRESLLVSGAYQLKVAGSGGLVRVGKATLALVGDDEILQLVTINVVIEPRQVADLVVTP